MVTGDLLELTVSEAAAERWRAGREAAGWGVWRGVRPILEAYQELLDLLNYLAEERKLLEAEGRSATWVHVVEGDARELANIVRLEARAYVARSLAP
jgi:hypothetical protein